MKVAVVYNRGTGNVINLFGMPNREKIGLKTIARIAAALKARGHQVVSMEGGKDLVEGSCRPSSRTSACARRRSCRTRA